MPAAWVSRLRRAACLQVFACVAVIAPTTARAQLAGAAGLTFVKPTEDLPASEVMERPLLVRNSAPAAKRASWWAPAASLLVPGSGQLLLGQQRSVAYGVAEVFLLAQALTAQRDVSTGVRDYQRVARDAARKPFGGSLPIGPWRYYEALEKYDASGAFDVIPGGAVDPETDESTFNGESWLLARTTYWNDPRTPPALNSPAYKRALAFYEARAYRDEYAWTWRSAQLQKDVYVQAVSSANRSNQRKTNLITVVGANHLASLIDAYITVRVRRYGGAGLVGLRLDGVETQVGLEGDPADGRRTVRTGLRLVPVR